MSGNGKDEPKPVLIEFATDWQHEDIEALPTIYANQVYVTHSGPEFYLVFGETFPPLVKEGEKVPEPDERQVPVRLVAKIAMSPSSMGRMVDVLKRNWKTFLDNVQKDKP